MSGDWLKGFFLGKRSIRTMRAHKAPDNSSSFSVYFFSQSVKKPLLNALVQKISPSFRHKVAPNLGYMHLLLRSYRFSGRGVPGMALLYFFSIFRSRRLFLGSIPI